MAASTEMTVAAPKKQRRSARRDPAPRGPSRRRRADPYLLIAPAITVLAIVYLWPTLYNIWLSLRDVPLQQMLSGGTFTGLSNYVDLLQRPAIYDAFYNTVVILTLVTVALRIVLGLGLAVLYNAKVLHRLKLVGVTRSLMLLPWVVPPVVATATFTWIYEPQYGFANKVLLELGLIDQSISFLSQPGFVWFAIISVVIWNELPFAVLMFSAGLQSIPEDLYEAARLDGAGGVQLLRYITVPMLRPITLVVALLTSIWTYNNFVFVWLMTRGGPGNSTQVLTTRLYTEGFLNFEIGRAAALGVLMSLVMTILAAVYYRYVVSKGQNSNG